LLFCVTYTLILAAAAAAAAADDDDDDRPKVLTAEITSVHHAYRVFY